MKIPKLRFPEFKNSGEWVEKPILDIASMKARIGWQNLRKEEYLDNGIYYLITGTDFENGKINWDKAKFVSYERFIQDSNIILKEGDILITKDGSIGKLAFIYELNNKKATLNSGIFRIRLKSENKLFIFYTFFSPLFKSFMNKLTAGSSITHLYQKDFKNYKLIIPKEIKEQQKIADTLKSLDDLIEAQSKKVEKLKEYKKGLMQKLFPAEGKKVPEIRFKEFSGEWVEKRLGDIAEIFKGKGLSKNDIVKNGKFKCIRYGELYTIYNETIHSIKSTTNNINKNNYILSKKNDVLIPASGETQEDIATASCILEDNVILGSDINIIRGEFDGRFLAYYLSGNRKRDIEKLSQGISVIHLYSSQLKELKLCMPPTLPEQQKIADTLSSLDNLIEAESKKIEALKKHKKGLMQQLFVGEEG